MELSSKQINDIEESIQTLATAFNVPVEKIIELFEDGYKLNANQLPYKRFEEAIAELRATFDCL